MSNLSKNYAHNAYRVLRYGIKSGMNCGQSYGMSNYVHNAHKVLWYVKFGQNCVHNPYRILR